MAENAFETLARNKNVARAQLRQLSQAQLDKLNDIVETVLDEKRQEMDRRKEEDEAKAKKVAELQVLLNESGLSVEDLLAVEDEKRRRGRPRKE